MCIIKKQFYILSDGRVWYEGKSYDPQDCEFLEGSYLVLNTIDEKIEKPSKKQAKIEPVHTTIERDLDMSLPLNLDMLITYPSITSQAPVTHTAIESPALPPEINQLQELLKVTGNNLPLAIAILIALVFYKDKKKKDQESQDHAVACDIERKDLLKRLDAIESEFKQFEKDQVKIMVGDGDIKDRIERLERHVKNLQ